MDFIPDLSSQAEESVRQEQFAKKQQEYHLIGKQRKVSGHILFEFNKKTKEIKQAALSRKVILGFNSDPVYETRVDIHQDCFYVQALNKKNAEKRLRKLGMLS